jgi:hypothetical protein
MLVNGDIILLDAHNQSFVVRSPMRPKLSTDGAPHTKVLVGSYQPSSLLPNIGRMPRRSLGGGRVLTLFKLAATFETLSVAIALSFSSTFLALSSTVSTCFFFSCVRALASSSTSSNTSCRTALMLYAHIPTTNREIIPPVTTFDKRNGRRARCKPGEMPCDGKDESIRSL